MYTEMRWREGVRYVKSHDMVREYLSAGRRPAEIFRRGEANSAVFDGVCAYISLLAITLGSPSPSTCILMGRDGEGR